MSEPARLPPLRLACVVQHYDWGDPRAIPGLLGKEPDGAPWAELWMGAHERAPASVHLQRQGGASDDSEVRLDRLIARDPDRVLGQAVRRAFGPRLPFLAKIIAASRALSIQCHPDADQAGVGFAREEARGVPRDARERSYKDESAKPELLVALTPFSALCGLQHADDVGRAFAALGLTEPAAGLAALRERGDDGLEAFFLSLLSLGDGAAALVERAVERAGALSSPEARWVEKLAAQHPGDAGALAPLFMHLVVLEPDEALFLGPGLLHAYLEGVGVEVMAASDNVLRAGLTTKHVDLDGLRTVARFTPGRPLPVLPRREGAVTMWNAPASEFRLSRIDVGGRAPGRSGADGVDVLLVAEGRVEVEAETGLLVLERGATALVPAEAGAYQFTGAGVVWRVAV